MYRIYFLLIFNVFVYLVACEDQPGSPMVNVPTDSDTYTDNDSGSDTYTNNNSGSDTYTDSNSGSDTYTTNNSGSDTYTDSNSGSDTYTDSNSGSDTYTDNDSGSYTYTDSDSGSYTYTDSDTDSDADTDSDSGSDADTDSDTDGDSDADGDISNGYMGKPCTAATETADCGTIGLHCVEGVCCNAVCTGLCASCIVPGSEGHCTAVAAGTVCRIGVTACDAEEICDGVSKECPDDLIKPIGGACGDAVDNNCDHPDTCDVDGICQPNYVSPGEPCVDAGGECKLDPQCDGQGQCTSAINKPDETACGDDALTECDKPDMCVDGVCNAMQVADGTPCKTGENTVQYRCSDTDCSATPQRQVIGWVCTKGVCAEETDATWEDVEDPCTVHQVCLTDETSYATCGTCDQPGLNECVGLWATSYSDSGYCTMDSVEPACIYEQSKTNCATNAEGDTNCVDGMCTAYTCAAGEHDTQYGWQNGSADGWTLNSWTSEWYYPWPSDGDGDTYLHLAVPANGLSEADTRLLSPELQLFACSVGTLSFQLTFQDELPQCDPATAIVLECGAGTDWVELWSITDGGSYVPAEIDPEMSVEADVDISPCFRIEDMQFQFKVKNLCTQSISDVWVDNFEFSAVQVYTDADTDTDTYSDTGTDAGTDS